jgi:hypothetical protein
VITEPFVDDRKYQASHFFKVDHAIHESSSNRVGFTCALFPARLAKNE